MNRTLKPNYGFWDITHFPIGGNFKRTKEPMKITNVKKLDKMVKGCDYTGSLGDGNTIAFDIDHTY